VSGPLGSGGLVVVDKPAGWTSHDVVARVRLVARALGDEDRDRGRDEQRELQHADHDEPRRERAKSLRRPGGRRQW